LGPFVQALVAGVGPAGGIGFEGPNPAGLRDREDTYVGLAWHLDGLGFGAIARAEAAADRFEAATVALDDLHDRIERDVIVAREAVRSRRSAIAVARDEVRAASEERSVAERRLSQGLALAIEVLAAEEAETAAASHLADAIVGYDEAQFDLLVKVGGRPR
ncbi:MAG: TolC family protein, partial [Polyangiaceae bacterium]